MKESIHFDSTTRLSPADDIADFHLHCAAVEWSLVDPIVLNSADEIQSRPQWDTRIQPFLHQQRNLFTFCRRLPGTLLADDVGFGKDAGKYSVSTPHASKSGDPVWALRLDLPSR